MRQKFLIFLSVVFLFVVLIGLNAASYVKKEQTPDKEIAPNRSTYNTGATGTRAFYELLAETGRNVTRWQENVSALSIADKNTPDVFVVIGQTRRPFEKPEIETLLRWVAGGGKLVLIDREPPTELLQTTAEWRISAESETEPPLSADPSDLKQMTEKTSAARPAQPTVYTRNVNAVQPSRFASTIAFERQTVETDSQEIAAPKPTPTVYENPGIRETNAISTTGAKKSNDAAPSETSPAPVAHLANNEKTLLADFPYGAGKIVFLSDPYIVSNGGVNLVDNAQLAINVVASGGGIIAFDEFHQGFGAGQNRLFDYFAGTPLVAIFLQLVALVAFVLYTQSRRFARPLPANETNRLSKLEYVAAMAELQQRTKAFDLAMENIYRDFRRRVSRLVGADNLTVSNRELARMLAERGNLNASEIENLLTKCRDVMHGEPTNKREILSLTSRLRELEDVLGLKRDRKRIFRK